MNPSLNIQWKVEEKIWFWEIQLGNFSSPLNFKRIHFSNFTFCHFLIKSNPPRGERERELKRRKSYRRLLLSYILTPPPPSAILTSWSIKFIFKWHHLLSLILFFSTSFRISFALVAPLYRHKWCHDIVYKHVECCQLILLVLHLIGNCRNFITICACNWNLSKWKNQFNVNSYKSLKAFACL